jgi:hypothetical protein
LVDQDTKKLEMAKKASAILNIQLDGAEMIGDGGLDT